MRAFVGGLGSSNTAALKGCWCFDCLYGGDDADFWFNRGRQSGPVLRLLLGHEGERQAPARTDGASRKERNFRWTAPALNVIDNSNKNHYRTASEGFPDRLKNVKLP